jgi:hypothetical protein
MRATPAFAAVVLASLLARCVIFTGGTSGYVLEDSGAGQGECGTSRQDAALWIPDGGACHKAAECGDSGLICCVVVPGGDLSQATSVCQTSPCSGPAPVQLCGRNDECVDTCCLLQPCTVGGLSVSIKACGTLLVCGGD